ncbi:hypothetical protein BT96DRAFT_996789 [Gymnopus androsaceus JB14]|uniref:Glucose-methanol-choline oxidoreductase C-terminal domain-containing protein n=1 Tax=Gymnopus androsaceus JB14 TaxID=1447944 RepID=A0A6A4HFF7_9AGAR|nr:hypothetical protein BT96DRAFT_996789 [Gymnopus androsaceus JB14]
MLRGRWLSTFIPSASPILRSMWKSTVTYIDEKATRISTETALRMMYLRDQISNRRLLESRCKLRAVGRSGSFYSNGRTETLPNRKKHPDTTPGPDTPDVEIFCTPLSYKDHGASYFSEHTLATHVVLLRPSIEGYVRLKSPNSWIDPSVDPKYSQVDHDVEKILLRIRFAIQIQKTEPVASHIGFDDPVTN